MHLGELLSLGWKRLSSSKASALASRETITSACQSRCRFCRMCCGLYIGPGPPRSIGPEPDAGTTGYRQSNVPRNFDQPSPFLFVVSLSPVRADPHGPSRTHHNRLCHRRTDELSRRPSSVHLAWLTTTMRNGGSALYCAMDRRASEMECRALALRISALRRQGR